MFPQSDQLTWEFSTGRRQGNAFGSEKGGIIVHSHRVVHAPTNARLHVGPALTASLNGF